MKAKKENKVYRIDETMKAHYLKQGYDIYDDEGNIVEHSPLKKVAYGEYAKLKAENDDLKAKNEELEAKVAKLEKKAKTKNEEPSEGESGKE